MPEGRNAIWHALHRDFLRLAQPLGRVQEGISIGVAVLLLDRKGGFSVPFQGTGDQPIVRVDYLSRRRARAVS